MSHRNSSVGLRQSPLLPPSTVLASPSSPWALLHQTLASSSSYKMKPHACPFLQRGPGQHEPSGLQTVSLPPVMATSETPYYTKRLFIRE